MKNIARTTGLWLLICSVGLLQLAFADTAEETALKAVVREFYKTYTAEELDGYMALWAADSPDYGKRKTAMEGIFAENDDITLDRLAFVEITVDGDKASVRINAEMQMRGTDVQTGKPAEIFGQLDRTLEFVRVEGEWKVWSYGQTTPDMQVMLALALITTETKAQRAQLLTEQKELVTANLARMLYHNGNELAKEGKFETATRLNDIAFEVAAFIDDKGALAWCYMYRGFILRYQAKYADAVKNYQRAREQFAAARDKSGEVASLGNIGSIYIKLGDYTQALKYQQDALEIQRAIGDKAYEGKLLGNIGVIYQSLGDYTQALKYQQNSLDIARAIGNKSGEADPLGNIGVIYQSLGDYTQALKYQQDALEINRAIRDKSGEANSLINIGEIYRHQGEYMQALEYQQDALEINRAIGDKSGEVNSLGNIGIIHASSGNYTQALESFRVVLETNRALGNKADEAKLLTNIGNIYIKLGDYTQALKYQQDSIEIDRAIGNKSGEADSLTNIGIIYGSLGDYTRALKYQQDSLEIKRALGNKSGEADSLVNIGVIFIYNGLGDYTQALEYMQDALEIKRAIGDKAGEAGSLVNIGVIYQSLGKNSEALKAYSAAQAIAETIQDTDTAFRALWGKGSVYRQGEAWVKAASAYEDAIDYIESIRANVGAPSLQMGFFEQYITPYEGLIESYHALGQPEQAFGYVERAKGRTLVQLLAAKRTDRHTVMSGADLKKEAERNGAIIAPNQTLRGLQQKREQLTKKYARLKRQSNVDTHSLQKLEREIEAVKKDISETQGTLFVARQDYNQFIDEMYHKYPELQMRTGDFKPLELDEAKKWFKTQGIEDMLTLSYLVATDRVWLFALHSDGAFALYPIEMEYTELKNRVDAVREALSDLSMISDFADLLAKLDPLIAPAQSMLDTAQRVCIIPDDILWNVPFAALKTEGDTYLIETHAVFYAPSLTALKVGIESSEEKSFPARQLLAMAPFVSENDDGQAGKTQIRSIHLRDVPFDSLPFSGSEVQAVSEVFPDTLPYLGDRATETVAKIRASDVSILHFATHGYFDGYDGMYSGLVLAEEATEDGYLEAREIMDLKLNASLVVLSACETARGEQSRGEGIIGLSWAFRVAGCESTVVSQWKVADASTAELMKAFYGHLVEKDDATGKLQKAMGKAQALRQAQRDLLNSPWKNPYYWAPFLLVGDWR